jgi:hypothetical protein
MTTKARTESFTVILPQTIVYRSYKYSLYFSIYSRATLVKLTRFTKTDGLELRVLLLHLAAEFLNRRETDARDVGQVDVLVIIAAETERGVKVLRQRSREAGCSLQPLAHLRPRQDG